MIPQSALAGGSPPRADRQAVTEAAASRVVPKPVPKRQTQDARAYQIEQLRRRYAPKEISLPNGDTSLSFKLAPSDPDFPFELDHLECELRIPKTYPKGLAQLQIKNTNIPRGFAINIEHGWEKLAAERRGATLLSLTNALDKNLESLLSEQKAETVKLTIFKDTRHLEGETSSAQADATGSAKTEPLPERRRYVPEPSFTKDQIAEAKARRAQETKQLEARMSQLPMYRKSADGIIYTLPLEPKRRAALPVGLQSVQSVQLIIPLLYPLQQLRVLLNDVESTDADGVEEIFCQKAAEQKQMNLMSHVNYLATNMSALAREAQKLAQPTAVGRAPDPDAVAREVTHTATLENDRGHVHTIPRPPEWMFGNRETSSGSSEDDTEDDEDEEGGAAVGPQEPEPRSGISGPIVEKGTAMSFPSVELHGIELLQVSILALTVKCERCKTLNDMTGLKDNIEKSSSCKKCASAMMVRYRQELVHQNSTRAGFIDVSGCTVADLLPSTFVPTCAKCSTASQGLVSVRGETTTNVCRECHGRFTFRLPDVRFLAYTPGVTMLPKATGPRQRTEKLGLHAGTPLPGRGACEHYKRSYRWFRFSCCSKVHPCDQCHDRAEDHVNEWANRMICGWCSREQNYSPESCAFCGRSVIGKRGNGFWEGGKGTRNQLLMRRGDKRKHRRIGGSEGKKKDA